VAIPRARWGQGKPSLRYPTTAPRARGDGGACQRQLMARGRAGPVRRKRSCDVSQHRELRLAKLPKCTCWADLGVCFGCRRGLGPHRHQVPGRDELADVGRPIASQDSEAGKHESCSVIEREREALWRCGTLGHGCSATAIGQEQ
jgi:hypothetical protein